MSGASPIRPGLAAMRILLRAGRTMGGPLGTAVELAILTLALPYEVVAMRLERIDWSIGLVPVPARGGVERIVALSQAAQQAIVRVAGSARGSGQVITAGRGSAVRPSQLRLDRLLDRLADAEPETISLPEWNFFGLREEAIRLLAADGATADEIDATLGRQLNRERGRTRFAGRPRGETILAGAGAERWSRILLDGQASRRPDAARR